MTSKKRPKYQMSQEEIDGLAKKFMAVLLGKYQIGNGNTYEKLALGAYEAAEGFERARAINLDSRQSFVD